MTECIRKKDALPLYKWGANIICILITVLLLLLSSKVNEGVIYGLKLFAFNILPTLFPFFILSDLWQSYFTLNENSFLTKTFRHIFHISGIGLYILSISLICGFPLGVKAASEAYSRGALDKKQLQALSGFANNPSLAFVISGIGMGIYNSIYIGVILYVIVVFSALLVGIIFRPSFSEQQNTSFIQRQKFDLVSSIANAGTTSIRVGSYIVFFCSVINPVISFSQNQVISSLFSALCEVGSAATIISKCNEISFVQRLALTSFALGFSGISVHLQAFSFLPTEISKKKYLIMKLLQGVISAVISFIFFDLFYK